MRNFLLVTNPEKDEGLSTMEFIKSYLSKKGAGCEVCVRNVLPQNIITTDKGEYIVKGGEVFVPDYIECVIVLGGDGTLLQAARDMRKSGVPVIAINMGTLGYLAEIEMTKPADALNKLLEDDYIIEERIVLSGEVYKGGELFLSNEAINDIVLTRGENARVTSFEIMVNEISLSKYLGDGVLIATPTGSTGYNLSAGGPIALPNAPIMIMTPICPHSLYSKSIIFSESDEVVVKIKGNGTSGDGGTTLHFDGSIRTNLDKGDEVRIKISPDRLKMIKISNGSFLATLNKKLGL